MSTPKEPKYGIDSLGRPYTRQVNVEAPVTSMGNEHLRAGPTPPSATGTQVAADPKVIEALTADLDAYDPNSDLSGGQFLESRGWRVSEDDFRSLHEILMESDYVDEGDSSRIGLEGGLPRRPLPAQPAHPACGRVPGGRGCSPRPSVRSAPG